MFQNFSYLLFSYWLAGSVGWENTLILLTVTHGFVFLCTVIRFHSRYKLCFPTLSDVNCFFSIPTSSAHPEETKACRCAEQRALWPGDGVQLPTLPRLHQRAQPWRGHPGHDAKTQRPPEILAGRACTGATTQAQREAAGETEGRKTRGIKT